MVLTAAHVYDKRPEACGLLNLAALCQRCHLRHDAKDRAQGRRAMPPDRGSMLLNGKDLASASSAGETSPVEGRTAQLTLWGEQN